VKPAGAAAAFEFILDNSILLIAGAMAALIWANADAVSTPRLDVIAIRDQ
jgi:hypothetical protein